VRRRFFRSAGRTQSRTEVVADTAVRMQRSAAVEKALRSALTGLVSGL
jgi:hypothetical protein